MAEFAGFTDQQLFTLAKQKGYTGHDHSDEVNAFIMGNDQARSYVFDMYNQATTLVGRQARGFNKGGTYSDEDIANMSQSDALALVNQLGGANVKWDGTNHGDYSNLDSFKSYSGWGTNTVPFETWKSIATKAGLGQENVLSSNYNISSGALEYDPNVFQFDPMTTMSTTNTTDTSGTDTSGTDTSGTDTSGTGGTQKATPQKANYSNLGTGTNVNLIDVQENEVQKKVQTQKEKIDPETGEVMKDADGNPIMEGVVDEDGNPVMEGVVDAQGNPVLVPASPTLVDPETGQVTSKLDKPDIGNIGSPDKVSESKSMDATTVEDVSKSKDKVDEVTDTTVGAKGEVSDDALAEGQTMDQDGLGQLGLTAAQISEAQKVKDPTKRTVQDNELVQSAYDKDKADAVIKATEQAYATASPSTKALVKGQLDELMTDFEDGRTPPWAAGAMRTAFAAMNARGLSTSSLAGQAIVQAAMESALPIAKADATTQASFEMKNLSNRQEAVMKAAEQRATFLGQEFNMEFQARVKNATTISEIAKQNYDADVQIALENARMAQSVDIANLSAENAKILSDSAALTKLDITNLTNKQQAEVANARAFLEMDMKNLDNKQQATMFKAEAKVQALFKDQAAENAAKQFNAEQKNQVDMFVQNLIGQQERFNSEQVNAMKTVQFQEDAANEKFFASLKEQRAQFNASQALAVSQANAKWYQDVTTANNAAVNAANMNDANNATALTKMQLEQEFQADRDLMNWAFTADDNDKQRAASVMIAKMDADAESASARGGIMQSLISGFVSAINPVAGVAVTAATS